MEKEVIEIKILLTAHHITSDDAYRDNRFIRVETTRGELSKKIDEICADIEATFDH